MLDCSVSPTAGIRSSATRPIGGLTLTRPSTMEYSECTRRCTKVFAMVSCRSLFEYGLRFVGQSVFQQACDQDLPIRSLATPQACSTRTRGPDLLPTR